MKILHSNLIIKCGIVWSSSLLVACFNETDHNRYEQHTLENRLEIAEFLINLPLRAQVEKSTAVDLAGDTYSASINVDDQIWEVFVSRHPFLKFNNAEIELIATGTRPVLVISLDSPSPITVIATWCEIKPSGTFSPMVYLVISIPTVDSATVEEAVRVLRDSIIITTPSGAPLK